MPDNASRIIAGLKDAVAMTESGELGALVIAVESHDDAETFARLIGPLRANNQGIAVIPFGASALAYCGPGALLFRGLVTIPPIDGPVSSETFNGWVERAIVPYLAPNAQRLEL